MVRAVGWLAKTLIALAFIGYPFLGHWALTSGQAEWVRLTAVWLPLALLACWVVFGAANKRLWTLVLAVSAGGMYFLANQARLGFAAAYGIPHAATYLLLLWFFGRTLGRGREALITRLARRVHGTLSPGMEAYTRSATLAWCAFFAGQVVVSALLFQFASLAAWSFFVNVLNLPLLALMFVSEYAWRVLRFPDQPHASIARAIRAFVQDVAASKSAEMR